MPSANTNRRWLAAAASVAVLAASGLANAEERVLVLKAARIHTVAGEPVDGGTLMIRGGEVAAVGTDVAVPDDARVIDLKDAVLTPGLVDALCTIDSRIRQNSPNWSVGSVDRSFFRRASEYQAAVAQAAALNVHVCGGDCGGPPENPPHGLFGHNCCAKCAGPRMASTTLGLALGVEADQTWSEQSSEVTPHLLAIDTVNLMSSDFKRLLAGGVTTVYVSPDSANVIGSRGTTLKTGGPLDRRVVQRAGAVKISVGSDPISRGQANFLPPLYGPPPTFHTRRPTTRRGVDWVFRKAFYDARRAADGLPLSGADTPPEEALPVLQSILAGETPVRIQARMQHDIYSAIRLADEFGIKFILEEATEAYRALPRIQSAGVPVIFGPIYMQASGWRAYSREVDRPRLNTPRQLRDAGIPFALTAQEMRDEEGLVRQAALAARYGLTREQALRAITAQPASLLGLGDRLGRLTPGAAADVVAWSGEPLDATSRVLLVLIDGAVVYDARERN